MVPVAGKAVKTGTKVVKAGIKATAQQGTKQVAKKGVQEFAEQGTKQGAKQAEKKTARNSGGYVKAKPKRKPRQPRKYEKKVENDDGSITYTLKTKKGELVEVTYRDGYPDFSQYKYNGPGKAEVKIDVTGNNAADFSRANEAAGFGKTPNGYTWHHHQDGTTMQLIRRDVHGVTPHTGGASAARVK
jgi:hypothetical protein